MILTAHQPAYLPWLGLFHRIALSDAFCILDTLSYSKGDFINRNRVKTARGPLWLTVPVQVAETKRICDLRIVENGWRRKHVDSIRHAYGKAPYYELYAADIFSVLQTPSRFLTQLTTSLTRLFLHLLGIGTNVVVASDYDFRGVKALYVLDMCKKLRASTYIFGSHGRDYASVDAFRAAGVEPVFINYRTSVYHQRYGSFVPALSIIDLLFNEGPASLDVIFSGNCQSVSGRQLAASNS